MIHHPALHQHLPVPHGGEKTQGMEEQFWDPAPVPPKFNPVIAMATAAAGRDVVEHPCPCKDALGRSSSPCFNLATNHRTIEKTKELRPCCCKAHSPGLHRSCSWGTVSVLLLISVPFAQLPAREGEEEKDAGCHGRGSSMLSSATSLTLSTPDPACCHQQQKTPKAKRGDKTSPYRGN